MKHLQHLVFLLLALVALSCEPRDPQVLTREEVQRQTRGSFSGNRGNNSSGGRSGDSQISWEDNFDTVGSLLLMSELNRLANVHLIVDQLSHAKLENLRCAQFYSVEMGAHLEQGNLQMVNCFFPGETSIAISGTLYFERRIFGDNNIPIYKIMTKSEAPLSYKIRGSRKTIDLLFDFNIEFSLINGRVQTHSHKSLYRWTNGRGQSQQVRIDGLLKPADSVASSLGILAYSSYMPNDRGPFFNINLESIQLSTGGSSSQQIWCADRKETYRLRFDYKPPMRRNNAELRATGADLLIRSQNVSHEPDRTLRFQALCQQKWMESPLSWIINPGLFLIE